MWRHLLLTSWRVVQRRWVFTAINLACIVITLVVLMVTAALLEHAFRPEGVEGRSERFVQVWQMQIEYDNGQSIAGSLLGHALIERYLRPIPAARVVAVASLPQTVSVYQDGGVTTLSLRRVDAPYWQILDFTLLAGRLTTADDDAAGRSVAVINQTSALRLFGSAPALGQRLMVGSQTFEVVGVVRDEQHVNAYADLWVPVASQPNGQYRLDLQGDFTALLMADDADGVPAIRQAVLEAARRVQYPDDRQGGVTFFWADSKLDMAARVLMRRNREADSGAGRLLAGIALAMLLFMALPALNLVNLQVGRILERRTEIGVRKAFGATRRQLVGQLVLENLVLCAAGGVIAAMLSVAVLWAIEASGVVPYLRVQLNLAVAGWCVLLTLVFGVLSGILPAWRMSRLDPVHALKG
jgi:putative ABC transport system permease protein